MFDRPAAVELAELIRRRLPSELDDLAAWYPEAAADFIAFYWPKRKGDVPTFESDADLAVQWARTFARHGATEDRLKEAFEAVKDRPPLDPQTKKPAYSRPDLFRAVQNRAESHARKGGVYRDGFDPRDSWDRAPPDVRAEIVNVVRQLMPDNSRGEGRGSPFELECWRELARRSRRTTEQAPAPTSPVT